MKKYVVLLSLIMVAALAGCASAAATSVARLEEPGAAPPMEAPVVGISAKSGGGGFVSDTGVVTGDIGANENRMVIKNGDLSIVVADPAASMKIIAGMADEMGGFIVSSSLGKIYTGDGVEVPEAYITIRVPAERMEEAMEKVKALVENPATDILTENVSGQDVTQEYTDLASRLRNLEAARDQLENIMDSATKTEDVLAVYSQLVYVNEQIEVIKGQMKYYETSADMSAISIRLQAKAAVKPLTIGSWQPVGVARDAVQALIWAAKALANILIWSIIFILPIGAILYFLVRGTIWVIRKLFKRRKPRKVEALPVEVKPEEKPALEKKS